MKFVKFILDFFTDKADKSLSLEQLNRTLVLAFSNLFVLFFCLVYLVIALIVEKYLLATVVGFTAVLLYLNYILIFYNNKLKLAGNYLLLICAGFLIYLFINTKTFNTNFL